MSTSPISDLPSLEALKKDALHLGQEAAAMARDRVLRPAQEMIRDSREHLGATGEHLKEGAEHTEEVLRAQRDRLAGWIADHPLTAVGLAVGAGVLLGELLRDRR